MNTGSYARCVSVEQDTPVSAKNIRENMERGDEARILANPPLFAGQGGQSLDRRGAEGTPRPTFDARLTALLHF